MYARNNLEETECARSKKRRNETCNFSRKREQKKETCKQTRGVIQHINTKYNSNHPRYSQWANTPPKPHHGCGVTQHQQKTDTMHSNEKEMVQIVFIPTLDNVSSHMIQMGI